MRIAFRADASVQIGSGHMMRCLTLADELTRQGHECLFVCREHKGHLGDLIVDKGYETILLPASTRDETPAESAGSSYYAAWLGVPWEEDASQTQSALATSELDWLVVDHYALDANWERAVAGAARNIMVIDDLANRVHEGDLLLDQNLGRTSSDYDGLVPEHSKRLIGPGYALLRPEFAQLRERSLERRAKPELKRIIISLGGVDRTNVTGQVLNALAEMTLPEDVHLDIIMGAAAPYLDEVWQQAERLPFYATVNVGVTDMAERMCLADLAIGAAGGTSWERCCLGLPSVVIVLAENQVSGARALEAHGVASSIADVQELKRILPEVLERVAEPRALKGMSNASASVSDGFGVCRVVDALKASVGSVQ